LGPKLRCVVGEHDYYADLGAHWSDLFGSQFYSFDHKGVHFVVLNSVLTHEEWLLRWPSGEQRMYEMTSFGTSRGAPFMVGNRQLAWLQRDLANIARTTPIVLFSHAPLQKINRALNFWTEDAEDVHALLAPFGQVSVLYGHVHQVQSNQIGNI